jgi:hypothetical protein
VADWYIGLTPDELAAALAEVLAEGTYEVETEDGGSTYRHVFTFGDD